MLITPEGTLLLVTTPIELKLSINYYGDGR